MTYEPTSKQEQAIREWLQEAIVPLIEQVLVKKLGQAMSFAAKEVVQPQRKPLTNEEIKLVMDGRGEEGDDDYVKPAFDPFGISEDDLMNFARAIEGAHGIKGDA